MANVWTMFRKEFGAYVNSPIAYIFIVLFLALGAVFFLALGDFFNQRIASMRGYFEYLPWLFLFFVPAVTMRSWAEERKLGTIELLMTFPATTTQVVLGKALACLALIALTLLLTFPIPAALMLYGEPDVGTLLAGYLGAILLAAAYVAIGCFLSAWTENQIVAFILAVVICLLLILMGQPGVLERVSEYMPAVACSIFRQASLYTHFESISRGVLDLRDAAYYVSLLVLCLAGNVLLVEFRKGK